MAGLPAGVLELHSRPVTGKPDPIAIGVEDPRRAGRDLEMDRGALVDLGLGVDPDRDDRAALDVGRQEDVRPDRLDQLDHRRE